MFHVSLTGRRPGGEARVSKRGEVTKGCFSYSTKKKREEQRLNKNVKHNECIIEGPESLFKMT